MTTPRFDPATDVRAWWRNQIELHPPQSPEVGQAMDSVRCWFRSLGEMMIETLPPGPDTTVALRALKTASMHAIGAIACNQWYWTEFVATDDERAGTGFVAPATNAPTWPDGSPIEVEQTVEVVTANGGWSGVVVCVQYGSTRPPAVLVEPAGGGDNAEQTWCRPDELIRRGAGKASGT